MAVRGMRADRARRGTIALGDLPHRAAGTPPPTGALLRALLHEHCASCEAMERGRAGGRAEESTACRLSVCAAVQFDMIGVELDDLLVVQSALIAATGESHAPRQELDSALLFLARTGLADLLGVALPKASLPFPEQRNPQRSPVAVAGTTVRLTLRAQMR